jgi:hypothetical protein
MYTPTLMVHIMLEHNILIRLVLSVFFAPTRYRVVKIVCFCSEVVLQTTKPTIFYPVSGPSLEVITLCLAD